MSYIFSKKREWWICNHNVGLFKQFDAFGGAEIAVAVKVMDANFFGVGYTVAVAVAGIFKPYSLFAIVLTEQVAVLVFVAGGYQLFQSKLLEIVAEIMKKVAHSRVVAVAEHRFATEMLAIVLQLVFDINELGVKFVFFGIFCRIQVFVGHLTSSMRHPVSQPSQSGQVEQWFDGVLLF